MPTRYRTHLLLGLLAFCSAQGWNRWNLHAMLAAPYAQYNVRAGRALMATDDASYLTAVDALLGDRPDKDRERLQHRTDLRAPGYRLWYLLPRLVLAPLPAISTLLVLQCLLYAAAVMLLWELLLTLAMAAWLRWVLVLLFAVMPTFQGFLFHTITEGVTPALSLVVLCSALLAQRSGRWLWVGLATWALLMVTRPALAWVGLALVPVLWARWRSVPRVAAACLLAFAPTAVWWVGNMLKEGRYVGLHPMYRADEPGITRPTHGAFWELAKSWGARGDAFHPVMEGAYRAALECDTAAVYSTPFVLLAPEGSLTPDEYLTVRNAFAAWQRFVCTELRPALASPSGTLATTTRTEQGILFTLENVTSDWRSDHPFHHHVRVPLGVLKQLVVHSNLNLFLFQQHLRGHPLMEVLRWTSAALHVLLLLCIPLAVVLRTPAPVRWCAAGACAYLFYLAYVQRGVEERYTLPVLFLGVVCAVFAAQRMTRPNFATDNVQRP